ncbi:sporulation inhibitor of replication protein SirA [Rossellomorea vietnamensis]|uniref:Sporulation inhibitor of replication protein SirA n=1 Tax=Rossellomorea vietnamensis TaxID=218284 RepID=A0A6I6UEZ7_9BACI|nr:sporulation inhibitor of replication protein SirA [Rossellomorea vietnamensis]QHE61415.1 sporulation inhibitor of replication protein SirA [Rossellomorea vietnamensis]
MRNYQIYWIEELFVQHYYGRERMFYQLFSDWEASTGDLHDIVSKQVDYITKPIPYLPTQRLLQHEITKVEGAAWINSVATIEREESGATLVLNEKSMSLNAWGTMNLNISFLKFYGGIWASYWQWISKMNVLAG